MNSVAKIIESFQNKNLAEQAFTHKSWINEHPNVRGSNERLEFLGDAVLEFIISKDLYTRFPNQEEGYLTAMRANLVNAQSLASVASEIGIGEKIYLSKGEEEGGGRQNPSLLADAFEAIIGAIFIDRGISDAEKFVELHLLSKVDNLINKPLKDAKSRLQEKIQSMSMPAPRYAVTKEAGPDHAKSFTVEVMVNGEKLASGSGKTKGEAEQNAAEKALGKSKLVSMSQKR